MSKESRHSTRPNEPSNNPKVSIPPELLNQVVRGPKSPAEVHVLRLSLNKAVIGGPLWPSLDSHILNGVDPMAVWITRQVPNLCPICKHRLADDRDICQECGSTAGSRLDRWRRTARLRRLLVYLIPTQIFLAGVCWFVLELLASPYRPPADMGPLIVGETRLFAYSLLAGSGLAFCAVSLFLCRQFSKN
jgi:hypothetical protein